MCGSCTGRSCFMSLSFFDITNFQLNGKMYRTSSKLYCDQNLKNCMFTKDSFCNLIYVLREMPFKILRFSYTKLVIENYGKNSISVINY